MYRYFLDNTLIDEPEGWDELTTTIKRDRTVKGLLKLRDVTLTFKGSGYDYLKATIDSTGHCAEVAIRIEEFDGANWLYDFEGRIFVSDIEWYEFRHECKTKITDNSYNARIYNNRDIGVVPTAEVSKNFIPLAPIDVCDLTIFHPDTGVNVAYPAKCFRLRDVFDFLVRFMSDGDVNFATDYFGASGTFPDIVLTTGYAIRKAYLNMTSSEFSQNIQPISFKSLFESTDKLFNINFSVDESVSPPVLRIENDGYFRTQNQLISIDNIDEVTTKTAVEKLFSKVKFGSSDVANYPALSFIESIKFAGFNQEEYYTLGQCNIDTELDLRNNLITSSNVIEYMLEFPSDTLYDNKWVVISAESTGATTFNATKTNWIGVSSYVFYNQLLNNSNVADRYLGGVPNSIAQAITYQDSSFSSLNTWTQTTADTVYNTPVTYEPFGFNYEVSDVSGNYNPSTYHYSAPASGVYSFNVSLPTMVQTYEEVLSSANVNKLLLQVSLVVYDSLGFGVNPALYEVRLIDEYLIPVTPALAPIGYFIDFVQSYYNSSSAVLNLNAGETVVVKVVHTPVPYASTSGFYSGIKAWTKNLGVFSCTASSTGGGIYQTYNPEDYPVFTHEFKYPLTKAEFNILSTDPKGLINFRVNAEQYKQGWIDNLKYNHKDGLATIKLISSKTLNQ